MGLVTDVEWCDSTLNLQMGCNGCELWNLLGQNPVRRCYAGVQTERRTAKGPIPGWPESFDKPRIFMERLDPALKWADMSGHDRGGTKPWLDLLPRIIFLDDMGDTFTEDLPLDWLAPALPRIKASPHQFLLLTKRADRMLEFSERFELPKNIWPGVSVTSQQTAKRLGVLEKIRGGGPRWASFEPLWGPVSFKGTELDWAVIGGESGDDPKPCSLKWIRAIGKQMGDRPYFVKQLGKRIMIQNDLFDEWPRDGDGLLYQTPTGKVFQGEETEVRTVHSKGGDWDEWPADLRVRKMPEGIVRKGTLF